MISFTLDIIPPSTTAQQKGQQVLYDNKGIGFVKNYKKTKVAAVEKLYAIAMHPHRIPKPMEGPILLTISFVYPWRKSETKANRALNILAKDTRPDVDNTAKGLIDMMTKAKFWTDDQQIADLHLRKYWGNHPGITIMAYEIDNEEEE